MFSLHNTLLGLTLGLAAWMGWLRDPGPPGAGVASQGPAIDKPLAQSSQTPSPGRRLGRQRTEPDPTSDDYQTSAVDLDDEDDPGSGWVIQGTMSRTATWCSIDAPSPAWSEPAGDDPLLLITHRFRC